MQMNAVNEVANNNIIIPNLMDPRAVDDIDRLIGSKIEEARIFSGLTRKDLAALIGVTHQQLHKYEKGVNRISAGRLMTLAQALNLPIGHFFEDFTPVVSADVEHAQKRALHLLRDFQRITPEEQSVLQQLVKTMANKTEE